MIEFKIISRKYRQVRYDQCFLTEIKDAKRIKKLAKRMESQICKIEVAKKRVGCKKIAKLTLSS
jgi:hypothetical protein